MLQWGSYRTCWLISFHSSNYQKVTASFQKLAIFNIYHVFAPFVKLHGYRFFYFFSRHDVRNKEVFLILEQSSLRGKQNKTCEKTLKHYKRFDWKTWQSQRFSEHLSFEIKHNTWCKSLQKWSELNYIHLSMVLSKRFDRSIKEIAKWNSQEKIKLAMPRKQN